MSNSTLRQLGTCNTHFQIISIVILCHSILCHKDSEIRNTDCKLMVLVNTHNIIIVYLQQSIDGVLPENPLQHVHASSKDLCWSEI